VDQRRVEISNPKNEITIRYNSKCDNDEAPPKVKIIRMEKIYKLIGNGIELTS
jgi:hypothetical protein